MPRAIPAEALNKIAQATGLEPVNIIRVQWVKGGGYSYYGDRNIAGNKVIQGKLVELADLEAVINIDKSGTTTTVRVTLNDIDGKIKKIFDTNDIHNRPVNIYQWFSDISTGYMFPIFEGSIATPIEWDEGTRAISFDVMTTLEETEVGFSVEDGDFQNVPEILLGKSWPLVFGTVLDMPAVQMDSMPTGTTQVPLSIPDYHIDAQIGYIDCQASKTAGKATCLTGRASELYVKYMETGDSSYMDRADQIRCQAYSMFNSINSDMASKKNALSDRVAAQRKYDVDIIPIINGHLFRQNETIEIKINDALFTGQFMGDNFYVATKKAPNDDERDKTGTPINNQFPALPVPGGFTITADICGGGNSNGRDDYTSEAYWACDPPWFITLCKDDKSNDSNERGEPWFAQAGANVSVGSNYPVRYILSISPDTEVLWLSAKSTVNGFKIITPIPPQYYQISTISWGSIRAIIATFNQPLSTIADQDWENDVYATLRSSVGPNVVDILTWLIQTYTPNDIDFTSFNHVRSLINKYPANFALLEKKNVVDMLKEIAWQSRCAIWLADGKFYLKYLPEQGTPVDTLTEDDIEKETLKVTTTGTEELVTKLTATWKPSYGVDKDNKIIFTYNVNKYGVKEQEYNFYIYNSAELVVKSAVFWLIRLSNVWKKISCKTMLTMLKVETMDNINVSLAHHSASNGTVIGTVEKATFNSAEFSIDMDVWLPVRLGEMDPYIFAYPAGISTAYVFPTKEDVAGGFTNDVPQNQDAGGDLGASYGNVNSGGGSRMGGRAVQTNPSDQYDTVQNNNIPPVLTTTTNRPYSGSSLTVAPAPRSDQPTRNYSLTPVNVAAPRVGTPGVAPKQPIVGFTQGEAKNGSLKVINNPGPNLPAKIFENVGIPALSESETVPDNTWGILLPTTRQTFNGQSETVYQFLPIALWTGEPPDEDEEDEEEEGE